MIGAIRLNRSRGEVIDDICQILATPWELSLSEAFTKVFLDFVRQHLGPAAAEKIALAIEAGNIPRRA